MSRLLLVEDDSTIAEMLAYSLRHAGYEVLQAGDGKTCLEIALGERVDLVIMDLLLPEIDGMTCVREILRQKPHLPIIILTARKDPETVIEGLEAGADDYVTKPFNLGELLARIEARLRRASVESAPEPEATGGSIDLGDLVVDSDARVLRGAGGEVPLTGKEHDLLLLLLSWPGHLFPREQLMQEVWHYKDLPGSRTLDVHVRQLRAKLEAVGAIVIIQTARGIGCRLMPR